MRFFFTPASHFLNHIHVFRCTHCRPEQVLTSLPLVTFLSGPPFILSCILKARLFLAKFYLCPGKNPSCFYLAVRASSTSSSGCTADLHSARFLLDFQASHLLTPPSSSSFSSPPSSSSTSTFVSPCSFGSFLLLREVSFRLSQNYVLSARNLLLHLLSGPGPRDSCI